MNLQQEKAYYKQWLDLVHARLIYAKAKSGYTVTIDLAKCIHLKKAVAGIGKGKTRDKAMLDLVRGLKGCTVELPTGSWNTPYIWRF